ncbi:sigma-70 family RNA polymerase sigma factor [Nocardioides eburneiflavus]|uniref:Sigma-70 family RNA polymerase sigma factor n=1 Tax=Nocardioides eburneiflavus TaxID=2518372 RepID=A0A4Z1C658_9ACTN|nr:sigma-70 family RNA polymerase sigma factor [Nocardioides eburneiflavus]TGN62796.1 sigma-70 family RNA polymerase sigma factor [Nocardioides eburneiflavus]
MSIASDTTPVRTRTLSAVPPLEGAARARRTDAIVCDLRDARRTSDASELTRQLIETNAGVARSMASRYRNRGIDLDDLEQVALLGLTKAAQRFDPSAGHDFLSFAVPTVRGELRRHFRDAGWTVRPPRRVQDLQTRISAAQDQLESRLGRSPRPSEVAEHLDEQLPDVIEALAADGCFTPTSLDATVADGSSTLGDLLGGEDGALARVEARVMLQPLVRELSSRDQRILGLRFYDGLTQQEIAAEVGLTQAQVSRVLARIIAGLRADLLDHPPAA